MALYEVWIEYGPGMYEAARWFSFGATTDSSDKLMLPMAWARGLAREINKKTGDRTEVRGTRAWQTVYARYGGLGESYGSIDDDMEGWR